MCRILQLLLTKPGEFLAERQMNPEGLPNSEDFSFDISIGNFTAKKLKEMTALQKAADQRIARFLASREIQGMYLDDRGSSEQGSNVGGTRIFSGHISFPHQFAAAIHTSNREAHRSSRAKISFLILLNFDASEECSHQDFLLQHGGFSKRDAK